MERALRHALTIGFTKVLIVGLDDRFSQELCLLVGNLGADESIGLAERAKAKMIRMIEDDIR